MFVCECGGILLVIRIEEVPEHISKEKRLSYNRVCDVQCQKCGKVQYSQPYDDGGTINKVRDTKPI